MRTRFLLNTLCSLLFLVFGSIDSCNAQPTTGTTLQGTVQDATTQVPIAYVQVYISGSTTGTVTDEAGRFEINTTLGGNREIVFSFLGYETEFSTINLNGRDRFTLNVDLQPDLLELKEIEVTAGRDEEWQRQFDAFRRQFIGTTPFAQQAEIPNPWHIEFSKSDEGTIIASSSQPIEIVNRALGYRIYTELVSYEWEPDGYSGHYFALVRFEELEAENEAEAYTWIENRTSAYFGSQRHFLHSLFNNQLQSEGFRISRTNRFSAEVQLDEVANSEKRMHLLRSGLSPSRYGDDYRGFRLTTGSNGTVSVYYTNSDNRRYHSRISTNSDDDTFYVSEDGELLEQNSIRVSLEWAGHRMGNFLPYDYRPPE